MHKIAFWQTLVAAYRFTFGDLRHFCRVAEPAFIAIGLLVTVSLAVRLARPDAAVALAVVVAVVEMLAYVAFMVAWHRAVLLGEGAATPPPFRFARREWRFLGYSLAIPLLVGVPVGLAAGIVVAALEVAAKAGALTFAAGAALETLVFIAALVAGVLGGGRLALALPAVALDRSGSVLRASWAASRRNAIRLASGPLLAILPFVPLVMALQLVRGAAGRGIALQLACELALAALTLVELSVAVAFVSYAYRQLAPAVD